MRLDDAIQYYSDHCLAESGSPPKHVPSEDRGFLEKGSTAKSIRSDLVNFQKFASGKKPVGSIGSSQIKKYLAVQTSRSSAYRRLYSLRKFFGYCRSKSWISRAPGFGRSLLPSKEILPYRERKCEDRPTDGEVNRLLSSVQDPLAIDPEGFIAVSLLLSGLKSHEVLSIALNNLPFQIRGSYVAIVMESKKGPQQGKKGKEGTVEKRHIPLTHRVNGGDFDRQLRMLVSRRESEGARQLLPFNRNSLSIFFSKLCRKARIRTFHPRDLRLIAMMDLKNNGSTNEKIANSLGVTAEYIRRELECD